MKPKDFTPAKYKTTNPDHIFTQADCNALWAAFAANRPLLLKGEPGTGKSQMAKAIAAHLGWALVEEVINYHTELNDLFYHFDAVQRLADAQIKQASNDETTIGLTPAKYLSPGRLWWAFDWQRALAQHQKVQGHHRPKPVEPAPDAHKKGVVLLLDEIDKAQPELANGLLAAFGNWQFTVPYVDQEIKANANIPLLVVITSNDERELPKAFIRRCFVHTLEMESATTIPEGKQRQARYQWLIDRGQAHFGNKLDVNILEQAAQLLWQDRASRQGNAYKPGLAEYIDLLNAIETLPIEQRLKTLEDIQQYAFKK